MLEKVSAPVTVISIFDHRSRKVSPIRVLWDGKKYDILKVGLHHTYRQGRTLFHVFSVEAATLSFRLVCNTDTLHWRLEEISDGEAN